MDLSQYTKEDLAGIVEYYFNAFDPKTDNLAKKLATFGATADDIRQSQRIAVANGSTSFWPWYLADMLLERYA